MSDLKSETPADELARLVNEWLAADGSEREEAWNLIADFTCCNWSEIVAALRGSAPETCTLPEYDGALYKSTVINELANERHRQIVAEGWSNEHDDDEHWQGQLATAAMCYCGVRVLDDAAISKLWPWDPKWWKPKSRRENLIKAGALIIAEIERLDRKSTPIIDKIDSAGTKGARKEAMVNHASMLTGWRPAPAAPPVRSAATTEKPVYRCGDSGCMCAPGTSCDPEPPATPSPDAAVLREKLQWHHKKSGHVVTEIGRGRAQAATPIDEMQDVVVYEHDGNIWVRAVAEFEDGRFEPVAHPRQQRQTPEVK